MLCPGCGFENPDGMNFCGKCATPLGPGCPNCGFKNPPGFEYCGKCAAPISQNKEVQFPSKEKSTPDAERRQITVMFCDLVGSTALSEQLDPEDLRDIVRSYQEACAEVIEHYDGYIAQYLGDGLLVYFGYPKAHEDDAHRAVRAGLEIVGAMSSASSAQPSTRTTHELPLPNNPVQQPIKVRIGIHTGLVVAGEMGGGRKRDHMAIVGETPNVSARLQALAEPNTVVISPATHRLIEGLFDCRSLEMHTLKGISTPMEVYRVLQASAVRSRFEATLTKGLTPLVGREQEVGILLDRWEQAKKGRGQAVLISGDAGIGKSRLVQVLKDSVSDESHVRIESRCSHFYQNSALYPIIDHLQRFLFTREDTVEEKLEKLEGALTNVGADPRVCPEEGEHTGSPLQDTVPLFASLLSLPLPDRYPPLNLTPQRQKQKTMEALLTWLLRESEKQPVLTIVEDLHWVDSSTLDYLSLLVNQLPTAPILTLLTFRPDFNSPWPRRSHVTELTLGRLTQKQAESMVNRISEGKSLPADVLQQIVAKTDGVPLFVEELTKMVLESGLLTSRISGNLPPLSIPTTLNDSLMARLDRLTTVKEVAQLGATLGRDFTFELIQAVSPLDENTLKRELTKLVEAELLYQRGLPPYASYLFKHALIQEAAYQSLLKSKRQHYHQKIAQILEEKFPATGETQPELLAHHYTEAGLSDDAIPYCQRAGQRAIERSANMEAISHLTKGLGLLKTPPDTPEHSQRELDLQITLGPALTAIKGYADPEVEKTYARALELCQKIGETPQLFTVLWGQWAFYSARAEHKTVLELAEHLMHLAQYQKDPAFLLEAHSVLGASLFWVGELTFARETPGGWDCYLRAPEAPLTCFYLRTRPRSVLPIQSVPNPVVSWLSGSSTKKESRGTDSG